MKSTVCALIGVCSIPAMVSAGNLAPPVVFEPVVVEPEPYWDGPYVGITGSVYSSGDVLYYGPNVFGPDGLSAVSGPFPLAGDTYGVFVGYNHTRERLVFSIEAAYMVGNVHDTATPANHFSSFLDLKGRVGVDRGRTLFYGFIGGSAAAWNDVNATIPAVAAYGYNLGAGVEFMVTDDIFVGAEYIFRHLTSEVYLAPTNTHIEANVQAVQVRLGWQF